MYEQVHNRHDVEGRTDCRARRPRLQRRHQLRNTSEAFTDLTLANLARILCAVDLEKASERAFDCALALAVLSQAKLLILHAVPATVPFSWRAVERVRYLTGLRERAQAAGVKVRVEQQHGDPAGIIILHAISRKPDIVILGSNRRRGWQRFREGSVGERVLRRAAWPILIVPWDAPRAGVLAKRGTRRLPRT